MFMFIVSIAVSIISLCIVLWAFIKKQQVIKEGIIIGVVSGLILSFCTDANFRASTIGPWIKIARFCKIPWKYVSNNWADIKVVKTKEAGMYNVEAKNIATGSIIELKRVSLPHLPADLRYNIISGDTVIIEPNKNAENEVKGGSNLQLK